jgi:hypothetical protein
LWVAIEPRIADGDAGLSLPWQALGRLAERLPSTGVLVALLFAAYLLGVLAEALLGAVTRLIAVATVRAQRQLAGDRAGPYEADHRPSTATMGGYLNSALGRAYTHFSAQAEGLSDGDVAQAVRVARLRAVVRDANSVADIDRLRGEAEFRLQLVVPVIALVVCAALYAPPLAATVAVVLSLVAGALLAASANHCAERANDELADLDEVAAPPAQAPEASSSTRS